ncbi:DUF1622 domain-containing protein [Blastococcus sp. VKM Ac-2987]|uniref:DUF1622 domain-containing protein n=1 Tax=Blastococcus sp. VKM Ac-2987 TaxID=3004141 RepID=UPI0022AB86EA|nr:DUF1622 domain-containing protein [Blastococcus sp. VKM Ac-2987]MCZ2860495.1 DUF1622 domain-containing protein [Blastococcus sp. VKM Ac-2987]
METLLEEVVNVLVVIVEACGAAVIIIGAVYAFLRFLWAGLRHRGAAGFVPVRLTLGRFLALGLEFQLASDVLRTAVAPSWEEIGQLAAIAAIRTVLNYFLGKEIAEERRQVEEDRDRDRPSGTSSSDEKDRDASSSRSGQAG